MITVNVTTQVSPISVEVALASAQSVEVGVSLIEAPVTVSMSFAAAPALVIDVAMISSHVDVHFSEARDAYQLAVVEGFAGTRVEWLESLRGEDGPAGEPGADGTPGVAGANAEVVVLRNIPGGATAVAQYIALSPAEQMSGKWFVIAK